MDEISFQINSDVDRDLLAAGFRTRRRIYAPHFLPVVTAEAVGRYLVEEADYQSYIVAKQQRMGTSSSEDSVLTPDDEREMLEVACDGARYGFASYFEATCVLPELGSGASSAGQPSVYDQCVAFLRSVAFLGFVRTVTGDEKINRAEIHATRFRAGHFVLFNGGTFSADPSGKRRLNFELNFTQQWRPEWGGMLEVRGEEGHEIHAVMPCFNSLDLFAFPKGYWISQVAPFAHASRYAIAGSLYAD